VSPLDKQVAKFMTRASHTSVSVVVPIFNSAATLGQLVLELKSALSEITDDFEVILVNDGSNDLSSQVIADISKSNSFLKAIHLSRNYGQQNALLCGVRAATKKIVVTIDDDLQNPPSEIFKLLRELDNGHDVVYGVPEQEAHGILREISSRITRLALQKAMGVEVARNISNFRAFKTDLREAFAHYNDSCVCLDVILTWATNRFGTTRVKHAPRNEGSSNYTLTKLVTLAINLITGYSVMPLQIASLCGFCLLFLGIIATAYVVVSCGIDNGSPFPPGYAFLACAIVLLSATQLLALGIIGEYLARIYARSMGKPTYMVRGFDTTAVATDDSLTVSGIDRQNA
jgi:glycosyltransferase involved in cell wall biosynthesis